MQGVIWSQLDAQHIFTSPTVAPYTIGLASATIVWGNAYGSIALNTARDPAALTNISGTLMAITIYTFFLSDTRRPPALVALSSHLEEEKPYETPQSEKDAYVEDIIELLELHDLADAIIGYPGFGLGVGDRKRVTIGVELAAKPQMLLFLDEPTSGLDGQSAFTICRLLRKLADNGQTILCTIHQPSALLFETFDRLLLLERGGKVVYFGPVGVDGKMVIEYFGERGAQCLPGVNPAEYMLDAIGAGSQPRVGDRAWADVYLDSPLYRDNLEKIKKIDNEGRTKPAIEDRKTQYAAPWLYQFKVVLRRTMLSTWRQPSYQYTRWVQHLAFALLTGLLFLQLGDNYASLQYRIFAIFMLAIIPAIIMAQIQPFWIMSRSIWIREETSKTFDGSVFAATQLISEVPYALAGATVFFVLLYYLCGFNSSSNRAGVFWVVTFITELLSISLGALVSSFCSNAYLASLFTPFLIVIFSLTCGVLSPPNQMSNVIYSRFFYNVNPIRFAISTLVPNELHGIKVQCGLGELYTFDPPANQTCEQWASPYVATRGGQIVNPEATTVDTVPLPLEKNSMLHLGWSSQSEEEILGFSLLSLPLTLLLQLFSRSTFISATARETSSFEVVS